MSELKIIIGQSPVDTKVLVDDKIIGLIQELDIKTSANHIINEINITFPKWKLARDIRQRAKLNKSIKEYVELLKQFNFVNIKFNEIK